MAGAAPRHVVLKGIDWDWVMARHRAGQADVCQEQRAPDVASALQDRPPSQAGDA